MTTLTGAVGRLYDHLDIHGRVDYGEPRPPSTMDKEEMSLIKLKQQAANDEGVIEVIDKVKFFEKMLQKQKAQTHMEMWKWVNTVLFWVYFNNKPFFEFYGKLYAWKHFTNIGTLNQYTRDNLSMIVAYVLR